MLARESALDALLLGALVFGFALLGILTRPTGALAAFWPANAVLLGVLVRRLRPTSVPAWCGAVAGFVRADVVMGVTWPKVAWLTLANMVSIGVAHAPDIPVTLDAFLLAADAALYQAKQAGRNRVVTNDAALPAAAVA